MLQAEQNWQGIVEYKGQLKEMSWPHYLFNVFTRFMLWNIQRAATPRAERSSRKLQKKSKLDLAMSKHVIRNPTNRSRPRKAKMVRGQVKKTTEGRFVVPPCQGQQMPRGCPEAQAEIAECGLGHRFPTIPIRIFFDEENQKAVMKVIQEHTTELNPSAALKFEARMAIQNWLMDKLKEEEAREREQTEALKSLFAYNHRCRSCCHQNSEEYAEENVGRKRAASSSSSGPS